MDSGFTVCPKTPRSCHSRESGNQDDTIITTLTIFTILYVLRFFLFSNRLFRQNDASEDTFKKQYCYNISKTRVISKILLKRSRD